MTVKEAAAYLKMKEVTVYRALQEGCLPGVKIRGQWRLVRERIDAILLDGKGD